jgi:hypothetical protein
MMKFLSPVARIKVTSDGTPCSTSALIRFQTAKSLRTAVMLPIFACGTFEKTIIALRQNTFGVEYQYSLKMCL